MGRSLSRGVTLPEVLFALGLVAVAIIALVTLFVSGLRLVSRSTDLDKATEVARETVESILDLGAGQVPAGNATYDGRSNDPADLATGFPPAPYPAAQVEGRDFPILVSVAPHGNLKAVQVRVFYPSGGSIWVERYLPN